MAASMDSLSRFLRSCRAELRRAAQADEVLDRFELPAGGPGVIWERLITQIPPKLMENRVLLEWGGVAGVVEIRRPVQPALAVETCSRRNHLGGMESVYAIQWEVPIQGQTAESGFCVSCRWA